MKKFKLLCTVAAVVLAVGMFTTTAMAASFTTSTSYDADGNATVITTVTDITDEVGSQVTYIAYKNGDFVTADNILFIDQRKVESSANMVFSYTVPKAEFKGVEVTAIGLGSSVAAPTADDTQKVIGGCTVTIESSENGTITLKDAGEVYPGNTAALTITPDEGYELDSLTVNGDEVAIAIGATSYALAVEKDMTVTGTFREIAVTLEPEVGGELEGVDEIETLDVAAVTAFFDGVDGVDLSGIANLNSVAVKSVVGKLVGNPANFENYEFGLKVKYNDDDATVEYFPALDLNDDYAFAVRLIDTTAEQNAFQAVASVEPYIVEK